MYFKTIPSKFQKTVKVDQLNLLKMVLFIPKECEKPTHQAKQKVLMSTKHDLTCVHVNHLQDIVKLQSKHQGTL